MSKVYVLGAGSSVCARGPLVSEFKEASLRVVNSMPEGAGKSRMLAALGHWQGAVPAANVEEYYVLVDLLHKLTSPSSTDFSHVGDRVENAKYLIAKTLEISMGTDVSPVHRQFRQNVVSAPLNDGAVVSLNWDIAYDRAVMSEYGPRSLEYGYSPARPSAEEESATQRASFRLYKLHGSSNWWYCKDCHTLWYSTDRKGAVAHWEAYERQDCETGCGKTMVPFMIPPTSQKFESSDFVLPLTAIWGKARAELVTCSEVFFVGYSFPATDVQFRMFVMDALSSNPVLETLAVVTNPKFGTERTAFEDHYSRIFSDPRLKNRLRFKYATFEDWVQKDNGSFLEPSRI